MVADMLGLEAPRILVRGVHEALLPPIAGRTSTKPSDILVLIAIVMQKLDVSKISYQNEHLKYLQMSNAHRRLQALETFF